VGVLGSRCAEATQLQLQHPGKVQIHEQKNQRKHSLVIALGQMTDFTFISLQFNHHPHIARATVGT